MNFSLEKTRKGKALGRIRGEKGHKNGLQIRKSQLFKRTEVDCSHGEEEISSGLKLQQESVRLDYKNKQTNITVIKQLWNRLREGTLDYSSWWSLAADCMSYPSEIAQLWLILL